MRRRRHNITNTLSPRQRTLDASLTEDSMHRTIVDPRFRAELVAHIKRNEMSQAELARRSNVSAGYLSQILNGVRNPSIEVANALDETLGAKGALANLVILAASSADLDEITVGALHPRHVSATTIESLERVLRGQRLLDDTAGSAALLGPVMAQMDIVDKMVIESVGPTRHDLLYVAGQWAQFAGWLNTSAGNWGRARKWFATARDWASLHGDPNLTATVVSYQGHVASLCCQWAPAVDYATAALRDPTVYPGQRAYDAYAAARGHAILGDLTAAETMFELGNQLAEQSDGWTGPMPPWQYYRAPWMWMLERGLTLMRMGRHDPGATSAAIVQLKAGIDGCPDEMRDADWFAEYLVHYATALTGEYDLDEADAVLVRAQGIAEATRSTRVQRLVEGRKRRLAAMRHTGQR